MIKLGYNFENNEIIYEKAFNKHNDDTELTELEKQAISIIKNEFEKENIPFNVAFRRYYENYLIIIADESDYFSDFCRIKVGKRSVWVSIDTWHISNAFEKDCRFENVENKNKRYWKINLNNIDDFKFVSDLIVAAYIAKACPEKFSFTPKTETELQFKMPSEPKVKNTVQNVYYKGDNLIDRQLPSDFVLFDLETTSKYPTMAEILEIAAVKVRNNVIVEEFESLVNPDIEIPTEATAINGITNEMVSDAPKLTEVLNKFYDFIKDEILIGHNINTFDLNVISAKYSEIMNIHLDNDFLDTLQLSRRLIDQNECGNFKLNSLCNYLNIDIKPNHRAMQDVKSNFELYLKLKEINYLPEEKVKSIIKSKKRLAPSEINCNEDISNKRICITGEFACSDRKQLKERLTQLGAKVTAAVSPKTDFLLIGDLGTTTTHKIDDAKQHGTRIVYEKDFITETEILENVTEQLSFDTVENIDIKSMSTQERFDYFEKQKQILNSELIKICDKAIKEAETDIFEVYKYSLDVYSSKLGKGKMDLHKHMVSVSLQGSSILRVYFLLDGIRIEYSKAINEFITFPNGIIPEYMKSYPDSSIINFKEKSNDFYEVCRIIIKVFIENYEPNQQSEKFGCCSKYLQCSNARKCLHDDLNYARACLYRENLEAGKIFYGENRNID